MRGPACKAGRFFGRVIQGFPFSRQFMWGAVENLSRWTARDLARYFSTIQPSAASDGDRNWLRPEEPYEGGEPDSNIVACAAWHIHRPIAENVRPTGK